MLMASGLPRKPTFQDATVASSRMERACSMTASASISTA